MDLETATLGVLLCGGIVLLVVLLVVLVCLCRRRYLQSLQGTGQRMPLAPPVVTTTLRAPNGPVTVTSRVENDSIVAPPPGQRRNLADMMEAFFDSNQPQPARDPRCQYPLPPTQQVAAPAPVHAVPVIIETVSGEGGAASPRSVSVNTGDPELQQPQQPPPLYGPRTPNPTIDPSPTRRLTSPPKRKYTEEGAVQQRDDVIPQVGTLDFMPPFGTLVVPAEAQGGGTAPSISTTTLLAAPASKEATISQWLQEVAACCSEGSPLPPPIREEPERDDEVASVGTTTTEGSLRGLSHPSAGDELLSHASSVVDYASRLSTAGSNQFLSRVSDSGVTQPQLPQPPSVSSERDRGYSAKLPPRIAVTAPISHVRSQTSTLPPRRPPLSVTQLPSESLLQRPQNGSITTPPPEPASGAATAFVPPLGCDPTTGMPAIPLVERLQTPDAPAVVVVPPHAL